MRAVPDVVSHPCGTYRGHRRHESAREPSCAPCRTAARQHWRDRAAREYADPEKRELRRARARSAVRVARACLQCCCTFMTTRATQVYCSEICRRRRATVLGRSQPKYDPTNNRTGRAWRKLREQVKAEEPTCWLCGRSIDPLLRWPDRKSFSGDHVVPVAAGGAALDRSNVRASHLACNMNRERRTWLRSRQAATT